MLQRIIDFLASLGEAIETAKHKRWMRKHLTLSAEWRIKNARERLWGR